MQVQGGQSIATPDTQSGRGNGAATRRLLSRRKHRVLVRAWRVLGKGAFDCQEAMSKLLEPRGWSRESERSECGLHLKPRPRRRSLWEDVQKEPGTMPGGVLDIQRSRRGGWPGRVWRGGSRPPCDRGRGQAGRSFLPRRAEPATGVSQEAAGPLVKLEFVGVQILGLARGVSPAGRSPAWEIQL